VHTSAFPHGPLFPPSLRGRSTSLSRKHRPRSGALKTPPFFTYDAMHEVFLPPRLPPSPLSARVFIPSFFGIWFQASTYNRLLYRHFGGNLRLPSPPFLFFPHYPPLFFRYRPSMSPPHLSILRTLLPLEPVCFLWFSLAYSTRPQLFHTSFFSCKSSGASYPGFSPITKTRFLEIRRHGSSSPLPSF